MQLHLRKWEHRVTWHSQPLTSFGIVIAVVGGWMTAYGRARHPERHLGLDVDWVRQLTARKTLPEITDKPYPPNFVKLSEREKEAATRLRSMGLYKCCYKSSWDLDIYKSIVWAPPRLLPPPRPEVPRRGKSCVLKYLPHIRFNPASLMFLPFCLIYTCRGTVNDMMISNCT